MTNLRRRSRRRANGVAPTLVAIASTMCSNQRNADAFAVSSIISKGAQSPPTALPLPIPPIRRTCSPSSALSMCICINCSRVTSCQGYHFVESQHGQPHMDEDPKFDPQNGSPTIHVNYRTTMTDRAESEFERMMREHKAEELKAEERAAESGDAGRTCEIDEETGLPLHGEEKYDLSPVTTVEYDVVECADYVEDMGAWVRNMPEEIRKANPNFVPT